MWESGMNVGEEVSVHITTAFDWLTVRYLQVERRREYSSLHWCTLGSPGDSSSEESEGELYEEVVSIHVDDAVLVNGC